MCTPCSADRGWATPGDGSSVLLGRGIRGNRSKIYSISDAIFSLLLVSLLDVHVSGSEYADEGSAEVLAEGGRLELATGEARRQSRLERALFLSGSEECVEEADVKLLGCGEVVLEL